MMTSVTIHFVVRLRSVREDTQSQRWYFDFVFEGGRFDLMLPFRSAEGQYLSKPEAVKHLFSFDIDAEPAQMPVRVGDKSFNVTVYRPLKDAVPLNLQLVKE